MGHDLRAAVSDVIGGLRLIDRDGLDDNTQIQLERVRTSGEVLARLLEQGLSMMLGEDDFAAMHPANVQLGRMLYDIDMRWSGRAKEKGLEFRARVAPDVPAVLTLDRVALERVLSNTLSNAMKYADQGIVTLDVDMAPSGALRMVVADQGPGFSSDAMTQLFEYGGRPMGLNKPGSGLGMHITRRMTGHLGGTITVANQTEGGARVVLELPPESWTVVDHHEEVTGIPDLSRYKVLVAEDNATNRTIIGHMLAKMGAEYEIAEDGVEALNWLGRETFDLALIDIEMPRLSGLEVIRSLRAINCRHQSMPIVAITAYVLRADRDAIYAAGADAILAKPLARIETFGKSLENVLKRNGAQVGADHPLPTAPGAEWGGLDSLLTEAGPETGRELLVRLGSDLRTVHRDLTAGLAARDHALVRSSSHVLIALSGAVQAHELHRLARLINGAAHKRDVATAAVPGQQALAQLDRLITVVSAEKTRREVAK